MRKPVLLLVIALAVVAAGIGLAWAALADDPVAHDPTTTTRPDGPGATRGPAYVDSVQLLFLESWPVQVRAVVRGSLPTPCHRLGWDRSGPDASGRITLDVYSATEADVICAQVLEPFSQTIDLSSFVTGSYVLVVNGVEYPFTI